MGPGRQLRVTSLLSLSQARARVCLSCNTPACPCTERGCPSRMRRQGGGPLSTQPPRPPAFLPRSSRPLLPGGSPNRGVLTLSHPTGCLSSKKGTPSLGGAPGGDHREDINPKERPTVQRALGSEALPTPRTLVSPAVNRGSSAFSEDKVSRVPRGKRPLFLITKQRTEGGRCPASRSRQGCAPPWTGTRPSLGLRLQPRSPASPTAPWLPAPCTVSTRPSTLSLVFSAQSQVRTK